MRRIVILGCAGSGKSTLARKLGEILALPVVHLDTLYWKPGWEECDTEEFRARVSAAIVGDRWVTDGNYSSKTFDMRLPRADLVIWLDQPRWRCLWRVLLRVPLNFGRSRADMSPGCPEKVDWPFLKFVWNYQRASRPRQEAIAAKFQVEARTVRLAGDRAAAAFLAKVAAGRALPSRLAHRI